MGPHFMHLRNWRMVEGRGQRPGGGGGRVWERRGGQGQIPWSSPGNRTPGLSIASWTAASVGIVGGGGGVIDAAGGRALP